MLWGKRQELVHLISYTTYLVSIGMAPGMCLIANLRNIIPRTRVGCYAWTTALHPRFIVKRLQYLHSGSSGAVKKPFLVICLLWPLFSSTYRVWIYFKLVHQKSNAIGIAVCSGVVMEIIWGCFCYLMMIQITSIRIQLNLDLAFLRQHTGKLDLCRRRLGASLDEYGSLCYLCSIWMIVTISMGALGIASLISREYLVQRYHMNFSKVERHVDLMIWSEDIMCLILPLIAVGGPDLNYIWRDFQRRVYEVR